MYEVTIFNRRNMFFSWLYLHTCVSCKGTHSRWREFKVQSAVTWMQRAGHGEGRTAPLRLPMPRVSLLPWFWPHCPDRLAPSRPAWSLLAQLRGLPVVLAPHQGAAPPGPLRPLPLALGHCDSGVTWARGLGQPDPVLCDPRR